MIKMTLTITSLFFRTPVRPRRADGRSRRGGGKSICGSQNGRRNSRAQAAILVSEWEQKDWAALKGNDGDEEGNRSLVYLPHAPQPENTLLFKKKKNLSIFQLRTSNFSKNPDNHPKS